MMHAMTSALRSLAGCAGLAVLAASTASCLCPPCPGAPGAAPPNNAGNAMAAGPGRAGGPGRDGQQAHDLGRRRRGHGRAELGVVRQGAQLRGQGRRRSGLGRQWQHVAQDARQGTRLHRLGLEHLRLVPGERRHRSDAVHAPDVPDPHRRQDAGGRARSRLGGRVARLQQGQEGQRHAARRALREGVQRRQVAQGVDADLGVRQRARRAVRPRVVLGVQGRHVEHVAPRTSTSTSTKSPPKSSDAVWSARRSTHAVSGDSRAVAASPRGSAAPWPASIPDRAPAACRGRSSR